MIYQTIKVKGIGEVPIIGKVDSFSRRVKFYQEDEENVVPTPKQAQKEDFKGKVGISEANSKVANQPSLLFK